MGNKSHITSRTRGLSVAFLLFGSLCLTGCHDWPDERATAIEAQNILRNLSTIEEVPDANMAIPSIYKVPPTKVKQVVGGAEEWKLFYFAKYIKVDQIKTLVTEQFAARVFNEKGQSVTVQDYTVSSNTQTNQIIVRAPLEADIDAVLEMIEKADVPPIQVRIECMVSELYADLTVDRETTLLVQNLFGEGVVMGGKIDGDSGGVLPAFPGAALRDPAREKFGLKIGVSRGDEGHRVEALVDILVSRGYLKILMNPTLSVVNGQTAEITAKEHVPLQQVFLKGGYGDTSFIETRTEYYDIIDSLKITPHAFADGSISLKTDAQIGAYLTPEGIKQLPIVTERQITTDDNRIRHGESLIIGGIRKTEKRDVVRGVPILKDIPILNLLFSGRDFEERAKEVIFILTPTISSGGRPNQEMVQFLRERHSSPMSQTFQEKVMDPLGIKAREQEQQRQLDKAREVRQQYESQATLTRLEALEAGQQIEDLQAELERAKVKVDQIGTKADAAASRAEEARTEAQKAATEAKQVKDQVTQVNSQAETPKTQTPENKAKADPPKNGQPAPPKADPPKESPAPPKADPSKESPVPPKTDAPKQPPAQPKPDAPKGQAPPQQSNGQQPKPAEQKAQESQADTNKAKEQKQG
jgi:Flp pilus assembly secretin CpaC